MPNAYFTIDRPQNDPFLGYLPGSPERAALKEELEKQANEVVKIPLIIGGKEVWTDRTIQVTMPHDHHHVIAECCMAGEAELKMAIDAALAAKADWEEMPWEHRSAIFLKAADLITGPYRKVLNASTMLGQSKTVFQAEIDIAELADFLRFGVWSAQEIFQDQPASSQGIWNRQDYRPLDGFICAISPFNFTSIGGNLPTAPAIVGNVSLWKPSRTAVLSNYYYMKLLMWCGLPAGVINFVPCSGSDMSKYVVSHPKMAGFHFTGSTATFNYLWGQIGANLAGYKSYPRIVGETGGKDFIFVHPSSPTTEVAAAIVRGAFEYQGQKCSAASRAYIPKSLWGSIRSEIGDMLREVKMGDVRDFTNLVNAVIDEPSFDNIMANIEYAKHSSDAEVVFGGRGDKSVGYFIEPTVIVTTDPKFKTMVEELFGPVITVFVYDDAKYEETLDLCDASSPYALTGSIFARDRAAITTAMERLRYAAGNFYINDKPTGAVVSQQPFGGSRASGTNDKAGSALNLIRWTNVRAIKETLVPPTDFRYPFLGEK